MRIPLDDNMKGVFHSAHASLYIYLYIFPVVITYIASEWEKLAV